MGIVSEIEKKFSAEIDRCLTADERYRITQKKLYEFAERNIPEAKKAEFEDVVSQYASAIEHISAEIGMKIGAKLADELLK